MVTRLWSVILAGGAGRRLSEVTGGIPKQFWRPTGQTTLLDDAVARVAPLVPRERRVIVVQEGHRPHVVAGGYHQAAQMAFQPEDRGTVAGLLYGLLPVLVNEPQATVLLTPADHGIREPARLQNIWREGVQHASLHNSIVLFAAAPARAEIGYGWIAARHDGASRRFRAVESFIEKPGAPAAATLQASGGLINTMVLAAPATTLLDLCRLHAPETTAPFVAAITLPAAVRYHYLHARYPDLPVSDFSRDVLTFARDLLVCEVPVDVGWSDLGTPQRLAEWLHRDAADLRRPQAPKTVEEHRVEAIS